MFDVKDVLEVVRPVVFKNCKVATPSGWKIDCDDAWSEVLTYGDLLSGTACGGAA